MMLPRLRLYVYLVICVLMLSACHAHKSKSTKKTPTQATLSVIMPEMIVSGTKVDVSAQGLAGVT